MALLVTFFCLFSQLRPLFSVFLCVFFFLLFFLIVTMDLTAERHEITFSNTFILSNIPKNWRWIWVQNSQTKFWPRHTITKKLMAETKVSQLKYLWFSHFLSVLFHFTSGGRSKYRESFFLCFTHEALDSCVFIMITVARLFPSVDNESERTVEKKRWQNADRMNVYGNRETRCHMTMMAI